MRHMRFKKRKRCHRKKRSHKKRRIIRRSPRVFKDKRGRRFIFYKNRRIYLNSPLSDKSLTNIILNNFESKTRRRRRRTQPKKTPKLIEDIVNKAPKTIPRLISAANFSLGTDLDRFLRTEKERISPSLEADIHKIKTEIIGIEQLKNEMEKIKNDINIRGTIVEDLNNKVKQLESTNVPLLAAVDEKVKELENANVLLINDVERFRLLAEVAGRQINKLNNDVKMLSGKSEEMPKQLEFDLKEYGKLLDAYKNEIKDEISKLEKNVPTIIQKSISEMQTSEGIKGVRSEGVFTIKEESKLELPKEQPKQGLQSLTSIIKGTPSKSKKKESLRVSIDKAEKEIERKEEEEARKKKAEEVKNLSEKILNEIIDKTVEEAKRKAEEEAKRKAEEEAKRKAEEEAKRKAEEEEARKRKAEEEAKRKAEEEARRKAEEEANQKAEKAVENLREKLLDELIDESINEFITSAIEKGRSKAKEETKQGADDDTLVNIVFDIIFPSVDRLAKRFKLKGKNKNEIISNLVNYLSQNTGKKMDLDSIRKLILEKQNEGVTKILEEIVKSLEGLSRKVIEGKKYQQ